MTLHFFTAVRGTHERFIAPFIASALITHPAATAEVLVEDFDAYLGRNHASHASLQDMFPDRFIVREWDMRFRTPEWKSQPCLGSIVRFLEEPACTQDYTYITDVDMLFIEPILDTHIGLMRETGLCYTNIVRPNSRRLTGCMMVHTNTYYNEMLPVIDRYMENPESLYFPVLNDEELLYLLVLSSRLRLPALNENRYRPILSIHTSVNRKIFGPMNWGCTDPRLRLAEALFRDERWRMLELSDYRSVYEQIVEGIASMKMRDIFRRIYTENLWRGSESRSGPGSSLAATEKLRDGLIELLVETGIESLCDIPCGDFHWMSQVIEARSITYVGGDIVPELVAQNARNYPNCDFRVLDLASSELPPADLLVVRDALVHFDRATIERALLNIGRSAYKYVLMTHFTNKRDFLERPLGQWRPINFCEPPFGLPEPEILLIEGNDGYPDKSLGLWRTTALRRDG